MKILPSLLLVALFAAAGPLAHASGKDASGSGNDLYLEVEVPAAWTSSLPARAYTTPQPEWWRSLGDATLDSLIEQGLQANYDLNVAARRIEAARAAVGSARAGYMPTVNLSASYQTTSLSGATGAGKRLPETRSHYWSAGASASWEIDVFGKVRQRVKGAKAQERVSKADAEGVALSVASEIASTYIDLLVNEAQLQVAREHSETQLKVVRITEARHEANIASGLDVAQAKTVYFSTKAQIPLLLSTITSDRNALAVLLGCTAQELPVLGDSAVNRIPALPAGIPAVLPMELLQRRPDLAAARAGIEADAAALGVAKKDWLPSLTLQGSVATEARDAGDLFGAHSLSYSVVPTLSWTLFDGFQRRYATAEARANLEADIAQYNQSVLTALEEVDNALVNLRRSQEYVVNLQDVVEQAQLSFELSISLYKQGLTPFNNVADAQLTLLEYQNTLVQARGRVLTALITLHKALGGGFCAS